MGASMRVAEAAQRRALDDLADAGRALDAVGVPTLDDHGAPLSFRIRLAVALDQRTTLVAALVRTGTAAERLEFRQLLATIGIHLPIEGLCATCGVPWPCRPLRLATPPATAPRGSVGPGAASPASPAPSSATALAGAAPVDRARSEPT